MKLLYPRVGRSTTLGDLTIRLAENCLPKRLIFHDSSSSRSGGRGSEEYTLSVIAPWYINNNIYYYNVKYHQYD